MPHNLGSSGFMNQSKNGDFLVFAGAWVYHFWTNNKVKTSFNDIKIIYSFKVSILLSFIVKHLILLHWEYVDQ